MKNKIRIGTRKSKLAMVQTQIIIDLLSQADGNYEFEIVPIQTLGDRILDKPLEEIGGKGVFVSEFERALQENVIDLAIHSAKDLPMELGEGLKILATPKREDPRDVLVTLKGFEMELNKRTVIGTGSLRRQLQVSSLYHTECRNIRGNVDTRIRKLKDGEYDALILAAAGLKRLGMDCLEELEYQYFDSHSFIPAGGQGIIAIEGRENDPLQEFVSQITDPDSMRCLQTERLVLKLLGADCNEPVGTYAYMEDEELNLHIAYGWDGKMHYVSGADSNVTDEFVKKLIKELNIGA